MRKTPSTVIATRPTLRKTGRPRSGPAGERVADYPQMTIRLPPGTLAKLKAWSKVTGTPAWRLMAEAIEAAVDRLTGHDAEDVRRLARREASRIENALHAAHAAP